MVNTAVFLMVNLRSPDCPAQPDLPGMPADAAPGLPAALVDRHGRRVNFSALARAAGLSPQTARRRLLELEKAGTLRLLWPLGEAEGKRGAPVLYLRDPPLVTDLPEGERWRARLVEAIAALAEGGGGRIGCLVRTHGGVVEPVVGLPGADGPALVGFLLWPDTLGRRGVWATLTRAQRQGLLRQGFVLYRGSRAYFSSARVAVVPDRFFLEQHAGWMAAALDPCPEGLQRLMRRCNAPQ
jgi:hypothetical protein